jgi:hypothetical protein
VGSLRQSTWAQPWHMSPKMQHTVVSCFQYCLGFLVSENMKLQKVPFILPRIIVVLEQKW